LIVMSILPVGECVTFNVVAAMKVKGDWMLRVNDSRTAAAFGSRTTSPDGVVPAAIEGSVPNFFAPGSLASVTPTARDTG
jgi:hypothetical protein